MSLTESFQTSPSRRYNIIDFSNYERLAVEARGKSSLMQSKLANMTKDALVNYTAEFVLMAFASGCVI